MPSPAEPQLSIQVFARRLLLQVIHAYELASEGRPHAWLLTKSRLLCSAPRMHDMTWHIMADDFHSLLLANGQGLHPEQQLPHVAMPNSLSPTDTNLERVLSCWQLPALLCVYRPVPAPFPAATRSLYKAAWW